MITKYEHLANRRDVLRLAAIQCHAKGKKSMAQIWIKKADEMTAKIGRLTIAEAMQCISAQ